VEGLLVIQQASAQLPQTFVQALSDLFDRLPIWTGCSAICSYSAERRSQVRLIGDLLHRHRRQGVALPLRWLRPTTLLHVEWARRCRGHGLFRAFGCLTEESELSCLFADRDRLPLPTIGSDRLSPSFRYYAVIQLLPSRHRLVLSSSAATVLGPRRPADLPG